MESGLTPRITGRGVSHWRNDEKLARRAPVHGVVRQPPKLPATIRPRKLRIDGIAARPLGPPPSRRRRRLLFPYRPPPHREGGCAAGGEVEACASQSRMGTAPRPVRSAGARRQGLLASGQRGRLAGADEPLGLYRA